MHCLLATACDRDVAAAAAAVDRVIEAVVLTPSGQWSPGLPLQKSWQDPRS